MYLEDLEYEFDKQFYPKGYVKIKAPNKMVFIKKLTKKQSEKALTFETLFNHFYPEMKTELQGFIESEDNQDMYECNICFEEQSGEFNIILDTRKDRFDYIPIQYRPTPMPDVFFYHEHPLYSVFKGVEWEIEQFLRKGYVEGYFETDEDFIVETGLLNSGFYRLAYQLLEALKPEIERIHKTEDFICYLSSEKIHSSNAFFMLKTIEPELYNKRFPQYHENRFTTNETHERKMVKQQRFSK